MRTAFRLLSAYHKRVRRQADGDPAVGDRHQLEVDESADDSLPRQHRGTAAGRRTPGRQTVLRRAASAGRDRDQRRSDQ